MSMFLMYIKNEIIIKCNIDSDVNNGCFKSNIDLIPRFD